MDKKKRNRSGRKKSSELSPRKRIRKKSRRQTIFSLVLPSRLSSLDRIENFLGKVNRLMHCDEIQFHKLMVATTEAVGNAIIHGNKRDPKKKVTVTCECNTKPPSVVVHVRDMGEGFEPKELPSPVRKDRLLAENGRGIFLMRVLMDTVRYRYHTDECEVIMTLRIRK